MWCYRPSESAGCGHMADIAPRRRPDRPRLRRHVRKRASKHEECMTEIDRVFARFTDNKQAAEDRRFHNAQATQKENGVTGRPAGRRFLLLQSVKAAPNVNRCYRY